MSLMSSPVATKPDTPITTGKRKKPDKFHSYPLWSPRFWQGMTFGEWMRFWASRHFRSHPLRWPMALGILMITPINSALAALQNFWLGKKIAATEITKPPVFIIGHWRSGTTYLHELMFLDERYGSPTTYQCMAAPHFLVSEWIIPSLTFWLLPSKRPMDNMAAGWDRPQEDEFALLVLGAPTPYFRFAYPNDPTPHMDTLDMEGISDADRTKFENTLREFVRRLTYNSGKQILLKSPPHTGRVEVLAKMFPGAKFVHITRNPLSLFASTQRLWRSLDEVQGLEFPKYENLDEFVYTALERMYGGLEKQRAKLAPDQIYDLRYEDLVRDPVGEVAKIYAALNLGDFEPVRPKIAKFAEGQKDYQTNKHELDPETAATIRKRWALYFERYGYE